jgi:ubiquinone/menaquinone biosynthesis C-methylase UbiE
VGRAVALRVSTSESETVMSSDESSDAVQTKREIAGVFGRAAPIYDRVGPRFFSHFGRRLVELAEVPRGARVLDVATGRGAALFAAAEAVGRHGHVTGIDLSEAMVQETAAEVARRGLENVTVRQMDAESLRLPDGSFDRVLCGFAVFFFPQLDRALAEMRRVLRPGGRIAVSTWDSSFEEQWKWFDELVEAHLPPEVETKEAAGPPSPPLPDLDTPEELEGVMKAASFADIRVVCEAEEFVFASEEVLWSSLWSHGKREELEAVEKATGADGLDRFKAAAFERMRTFRQTDGIHQSFPALFTLAVKPQTETGT